MKRFLKAAEGMVLTNGEIAADGVFLAQGEAAEGWQEVTLEEAARLQQAEEGDLYRALQGFGVIV